jgi:hypothetical protein
MSAIRHNFNARLTAAISALSFVLAWSALEGSTCAAEELPSAAWRVTGVGSCTAAGCHGNGHPEQLIGSEYNVWITRDPHARAYSALFSERSQRMVELLGGSVGEVAPAHENPRCLACHSMTDATPRDPTIDVVSDGVGCEACHGPAEGYLTAHYERKLSADERSRLGLWDTDRLLVRTQVCVRCHVGSPGRDVNHDLLAAGHPRLEFEMGAYYDALPKHWDEAADRARFGPDYDALIWAMGQACMSEAALSLLADRATGRKGVRNLFARAGAPGRSTAGEKVPDTFSSPWPEFAEWSCAACHHDLRDDPTRQQRLAEAGRLSGQQIAWDTWNHATPLRHASEIDRTFGIDAPAAEQAQATLREIDSSMRQLTPDRRRIAVLASSAADELGKWAAALEHAALDRKRLDRLSRAMLAAQRERGVDDWSTAAQTYNSLASQHETRLRHAATQSDEPLTRAIRNLYEELAGRQLAPKQYRYEPARVEARLNEIDRLLSQQRGEP